MRTYDRPYCMYAGPYRGRSFTNLEKAIAEGRKMLGTEVFPGRVVESFKVYGPVSPWKPMHEESLQMEGSSDRRAA